MRTNGYWLGLLPSLTLSSTTRSYVSYVQHTTGMWAVAIPLENILYAADAKEETGMLAQAAALVLVKILYPTLKYLWYADGTVVVPTFNLDYLHKMLLQSSTDLHQGPGYALCMVFGEWALNNERAVDETKICCLSNRRC